jgi:hypothetical protein
MSTKAQALTMLVGLSLLTACSQQEDRQAVDRPVAKQVPYKPPVDLSDLFAFSRPAECLLSEKFDGVLGSLFKYESGSDRAVPGKLVVPATYARAFGSPAYTRDNQDAADVTISLRGSWHGLQVRSLYAYAWDGGDPGGFRLSFAEPMAKVMATLAKLGFRPPRSGTSTPRDPDTEQTMTITRTKDGMTEFGCGM